MIQGYQLQFRCHNLRKLNAVTLAASQSLRLFVHDSGSSIGSMVDGRKARRKPALEPMSNGSGLSRQGTEKNV